MTPSEMVQRLRQEGRESIKLRMEQFKQFVLQFIGVL